MAFAESFLNRLLRISTGAGLALLLLLAGSAQAEDGWQDGGEYEPIGSPHAHRKVKDREFVLPWAAFPTTLRTDGPNSNSTSTRVYIHALLYESMIQIHPETEEFIPCLAKQWKIETDKEKKTQTFTFRLDERAKWSDGSPVTAKDVYYSWWHRVQEDRNDPTNIMSFKENYEEPKILDEMTIQVTTRELNWRLFLYFGGMAIYPAKECQIPGAKYLEQYNWKCWMGTGPYSLDPADVKKGTSITLRRRDNWWAENEKWAKGTYNFNTIKFIIIRDREMTYEKFKIGELDQFFVGRAQRWVMDIPKEEIINNGWVKKKKIYNEAPEGYQGFAFNMRKPPFNDKNVRLAFCHLFNREQLFEKLFFNEYEFIDSYFPGRDWGAGDKNTKIRFDPDLAEELLFEAGYEERDEQGFLVDANGKRLTLTLEYASQGWERIWLVVQKDFVDAGIDLKLKLIDPSTLMKKVTDRQFRMVYYSWGALLFPNPETAWRSDLADKKANNNICGFKNARVDELCEKYNVTFDRAEQKKIVREIDSIIFNEYPYALGWTSNFRRLLFWDRFGHHEKYTTRISQYIDAAIILLWWYDQDKIDALDAAIKAEKKLPVDPVVDVKPWEKKAAE